MKYAGFVVLGILAACKATYSRGFTFDARLSRDSYEGLDGDDEAGFEDLLRADRDLVEVHQPLCKEIRTELMSSVYVPNIPNAHAYTFRPRKIRMVNCSREMDAAGVGRGGCRPKNCREKYVDIDVFGKPKSVTENLWQLLVEIPSVPIGCECLRLS